MLCRSLAARAADLAQVSTSGPESAFEDNQLRLGDLKRSMDEMQSVTDASSKKGTARSAAVSDSDESGGDDNKADEMDDGKSRGGSSSCPASKRAKVDKEKWFDRDRAVTGALRKAPGLQDLDHVERNRKGM